MGIFDAIKKKLEHHEEAAEQTTQETVEAVQETVQAEATETVSEVTDAADQIDANIDLGPLSTIADKMAKEQAAA
ncbi:MAG: hypothetical protein ACRCWS_00170, partial [Propionibacteriaceae bacterium]